MLAYARALLTGTAQGRTAVVAADVRDPEGGSCAPRGCAPSSTSAVRSPCACCRCCTTCRTRTIRTASSRI
ncbi:SAM-dependent methyltransferase [Frankia canadensis]|uniref:SAM-dependent methyltransferase n=1 Tax=Frankia canadensis TaxID=1836972 RepID=UPI001FB01214|nr:SAM-dependent methyltransferase [Frankia canadensis]